MATIGTQVQYGDILFQNVLTRQFRQVPEFDTGNLNVVCHRYTVRIVGYVHGSNPARQNAYTTGPNATNPTSDYLYSTWIEPQVLDGTNATMGDAAVNHRLIRWALMQPRQRFQMRTGGQVLLQAFPAQAVNPQAPPSAVTLTDVDVANGPRCTDVDITQIVRNSVYRVEAEFEVCKVECDADSRNTSNTLVLSNSWSCTDDIDRNFMTRRTFSGQLRTASALVNPHAFRATVLPPLSPGMRRDSMQFVASDDGCTLQYTVTDVEVAFAPPKPATTWSLRHTESVTRTGSIAQIVSVDVTLGGDRNVDKGQLISLAAAIAEAKFGGDKRRRIINSYVITDEYSDDSSLIHLSAEARRTLPAGEPVVAGIRLDLLKPIDAQALRLMVAIAGNYDRNKSRGHRDGEQLETAGPLGVVGAFVVYLQSPCAVDHETNKAPPPGAAQQPETASVPQIQAYTTASLAGDATNDWPTEYADTDPYTLYQMESVWRRNGLKAHAPIAAGSSGVAYSGATSVVIALGQTLTQRVIRMRGERVGLPPAFPVPVESFQEYSGGVTVTYTLLESTLHGMVPERSPEGQVIYNETREYTYAADRDPLLAGSNQLTLGTNPNDSHGLYARVFGGGQDPQGNF